MKNLIASILFSVFVPNAFAETILPVEVPNIIVSGTRSQFSSTFIPASIKVISRQEILDSGAVHLADVLRGEAGIQLKDLYGDGSRASLDMRGFGDSASSNILVLVDGRRLNNADTKGPDINSIAITTIERIEIISGSSGVLFGDQAVGGVLNIITRNSEEFNLETSINAGSYGRQGVKANYSQQWETGLGLNVNIETREADNYRHHNQQEYTNLGGRLAYQYTSGLVFIEYQDVDEDLQTPGSLLQNEVATNRKQSRADFDNDFSHLQTQSMRLGLEQTISEKWMLLMDVSQRKGDGDFILNFRGCATAGFCNTVPDTDAREQISLNPRIVGNFASDQGEIIVTAGIDSDQTDYKLNSAFVNTSNEQDARSTYIHAIIPLAETVSLKTGARTARVENQLSDMGAYPNGITLKDTVSVGELGVHWQLEKSLRLYARLDQNYRFAKADEQNFTTVGIIGLETQEGHSFETGFDYTKNRYTLNFTASQLKLENEIAFDPTANGPFGPFGGANVNFDRTQRETMVLGSKVIITEAVFINASWSYVDAKFKTGVFQGNDVSGVANSVAKISLNFTHGQQWNAYLEAQHLGDQYKQGDNLNAQSKQDDYTVLNMNLNFFLEQWALSARLNNLGGRQYIESSNAFGALQPSPERNFNITVKYNFN